LLSPFLKRRKDLNRAKRGERKRRKDKLAFPMFFDFKKSEIRDKV